MATLTIRIDDAVKAESGEIFSRLGLSVSAGISIFLHQVIEKRAIPFELSLNENRERKETKETIGSGELQKETGT